MLTLDGSGWRLPTKDELLSIVEGAYPGPTINQTAFPNAPAENSWTSSPYNGYSGCMWGISFNSGDSGGIDKGLSSRVRCVR
jgi:hypothetical protein